jgi:hypothetical protein
MCGARLTQEHYKTVTADVNDQYTRFQYTGQASGREQRGSRGERLSRTRKAVTFPQTGVHGHLTPSPFLPAALYPLSASPSPAPSREHSLPGWSRAFPGSEGPAVGEH